MSGDLFAVNESTGARKGKASSGGIPFLLELPLLIIVALVVAIVIKTFLVQAFWIPSGSMIPTLELNDRVLVNKLEYRVQDPARGDVVVFDSPYRSDEDETLAEAVTRTLFESLGIHTAAVPDDFIKRVMAIGGETIEIVGNVLYVDGVAIDEPYLPYGIQMADFGPITVEPGQLFVMGDNRNSSSDSRVFGTIDETTVVGRAFVRMWPLDRWGDL